MILYKSCKCKNKVSQWSFLDFVICAGNSLFTVEFQGLNAVNSYTCTPYLCSLPNDLSRQVHTYLGSTYNRFFLAIV